jgi:cytochrome c oxidase subunit 4
MADHAKQNHVLPLSVYLTVVTALLTLTGITVWVAQYDLGPANLVVAMIIAAVKGTLVALYFMHLRYDNKMYAVILGSALLFLAIFIIITMFDTLRRNDIYDLRSAPVQTEAVIYEKQASPVGAESSPADSAATNETASETNEAGH